MELDEIHDISNTAAKANHFFFPPFFPFPAFAAGGAGLEAADVPTLEAREDGAAEVALLPAPDFTLSRALFYL
jgi:hypothetical protein